MYSSLKAIYQVYQIPYLLGYVVSLKLKVNLPFSTHKNC